MSDPSIDQVVQAYKTILSSLPLTIESVDKTPLRAAKAFRDLTAGYYKKIGDEIGSGIFPYNGDGIVSIKGLELNSMCEHHLLPFIGNCSIAYIPDKKILGLSKLKRIADVFARRLQVQERLTEQIAEAVEKYIEPKGVLVVIRSAHMCMKMRGVNESSSETCTYTAKGEFLVNKSLAAQYFNDFSPKI
jgi:GTP cyclohydrolase IA